MGPLPTSTKENKYILVVTDLFSKWVDAFPLVATDSETLASVLVDEVVCRYGVPHVLQSDQGANLYYHHISHLFWTKHPHYHDIYQAYMYIGIQCQTVGEKAAIL